MRPSWDDTWLSIARTIAQRSLCSRAQVGAVIVTAGNRVVATGYNSAPAGFDHGNLSCEEWCTRGRTTTPMRDRLSTDYSDCPSLHAEANALMAADRSSWQGGTIYVLGDCCHACAKLIANSGLTRVVVQRDGVDRSYRTAEVGYDLLRSCGLQLTIFEAS